MLSFMSLSVTQKHILNESNYITYASLHVILRIRYIIVHFFFLALLCGWACLIVFVVIDKVTTFYMVKSTVPILLHISIVRFEPHLKKLDIQNLRFEKILFRYMLLFNFLVFCIHFIRTYFLSK